MLDLFDFDIIEIKSPSSDIPATEEQSTLPTSPIFKVSYLWLFTIWQPAAIKSCYHSVQCSILYIGRDYTAWSENTFHKITVESWALPHSNFAANNVLLMYSCDHISLKKVVPLPEYYNLRKRLEITTRSTAIESLIYSPRTNFFILRYMFRFLFIGRELTMWPASNCLQRMVCSCVTRTDGRSDWLTDWLTDSVTAGWTPGSWLTDCRLRIACFLCKCLVCSTLLCLLDDCHWGTSN